jgi:uncharacterized iron-regulated membrane protein
MKQFRKLIFWTHLVCGITAGMVIFIMSVTGAFLAFEKNVTEFVERDQRVIVQREHRLGVKAMLSKVLAAKPDAKPSAVLMQNDPQAAVTVSLGREGQLFVDPYTGNITGEGSKGVRQFFRTVTDWHRYIALSGDNRARGKSLTGAANLLFLFLAVSGIYIWLPRIFEWRRVRPNIWFRCGLRGKARNFNWHNAIGFWCSLVLVVLTLTATVISYQWAGNLLYTLTGNEPPTASQPAPQQPQSPEAFVTPENLDAIWIAAENQAASWRSISLRLPAEKQAVFTINEGKSWNIFGRSTLTLDAATGEVAKWEPYSEQNAGRQLRSWFRFTHTGETGGIVGQFVGFIACVGGAFLVWTGFSLVLRRFRNWVKRRSSASFAADSEH